MMPLASIDRLLRRAFRDRETHFVELTRHFFLRFFDNEWIARNAESRLTLIHVLALLAVPGALCSFYLYPIYDNIGWHHPELFPAVALVDQCRFVGFTLVVVGFVATLEWNALFPDRRDYTVLAPLPLRMSALFLAKAAALLLLLAVFTAAVNLFSGIIYPCVAMTNRKVTPWDLARWFVAHGLSVTAASAFGLLFFVALQGLLINTLLYRLFRKASVYVQAFSLMLLLALLLLLDSISSLAPAWVHTGSRTLEFLPPMWFLGIYQTLLGSHLPVFRHLANLGLAALGLAAAFSLAGYALAYRRHVQKSIESADAVDDESSGARTRAGRLLDRLIVRTPLERAAFHFLVKTLFRSAKHRLYLAAYVGAGFAFVLVGCVETFVGSTHIGRPQPAETLLSIPLILSFFTLSGMRLVFAVPAALDANWIFQLTEDDRRHECLTGVREAMVAIGIAPLFAALFPLDVYLGDGRRRWCRRSLA